MNRKYQRVTQRCLIVILLLVTQISYSQEKKDTVIRPVYLYEKTDTVKMPSIFYKSGFGLMKVSVPGYMIRKGWAEVNSKQFVEQPKVIGGLNRKHKPVTIL